MLFWAVYDHIENLREKTREIVFDSVLNPSFTQWGMRLRTLRTPILVVVGVDSDEACAIGVILYGF